MGALLDLLYLAASDPAHWPAFLASIAQLFDAKVAGLIAQRPGESRYSIAAAVGINEQSIQLYNSHYSFLDPWYLALQAGGIQQWTGRGSDLCPPSQFGDTEFYNDFWKTNAECWYQGGIIHGEHGQSSVLTFHRPRQRGDLSAEEVQLLRDLFPHLRRALNIHRQVLDLRSSIAQVGGAVDALDVGLIALGPDGRVRFANAQAEALLRAGDVLSAPNSKLTARDASAQGALNSLVAGGFSRSLAQIAGGAITITNGSRTLLVTVLPSNRYPVTITNHVVLLMLTDPDARPRSRAQLLATLFALTPAESRVAMLLLEGLDPNQIAERVQGTPGTVRFQLKMIYRKAGVSRQSQLVRLLSRLPGPLEGISTE